MTEGGKNASLEQYFNQNSNNESSFFDQISGGGDSAMMSSVVASPSTQDLFEAASETISSSVTTGVAAITLNPDESPCEPAICKIFATDDTKNAGTSKSFFDIISSPVHDQHFSTVESLDWTPDSSSVHNAKKEGPFPSPLQGFEDLSDIIHSSESDRTREAWIPSDNTRRALIQAATSQPGTYTPETDLLTYPGVVLEEDMADNISQLLRHHFGDAEANQRKVLTVGDVSKDEKGLRELIQAECFRAAINMTGRLLAIYGQGANKQGHPSKHTVHSIQLWFTRLTLLVKVGSYQIAEAESSVWWNLDRPDLYYQFYPELYGGKPGSMVPFQMRLLIATLPAYVKKGSIALERLYSVLAVVRQIIKHLESGKSEDGSLLELTPKNREISKQVWHSREARVLHSIVNVALMSKEYPLAIEVLLNLIDNNKSLNQKRALQSALGRVYLQLGNVKRAEKCFNICKELKVTSMGTLNTSTADLRELIDKGLLSIAYNSFPDAYEIFSKASVLDPTNIMVLNNMAVCLLYMGQLKNALSLLSSAIQSYPSLALHEALLINLCTLYELESSKCEQNKQALLKMVAKYRGDAFNVACLKLHK